MRRDEYLQRIAELEFELEELQDKLMRVKMHVNPEENPFMQPRQQRARKLKTRFRASSGKGFGSR